MLVKTIISFMNLSSISLWLDLAIHFYVFTLFFFLFCQFNYGHVLSSRFFVNLCINSAVKVIKVTDVANKFCCLESKLSVVECQF